MMITQFFYLLKKRSYTILKRQGVRPYIALTQCSHRYPLNLMAFVWDSMSTPCLCPCNRSETGDPVQCNDLREMTGLLVYRSDSYGHVISRLDKLISTKGDYFPSSAFSHISLTFSAATPWCFDFILPNSYQQACFNMDKANACYSMGSLLWLLYRWDFSRFSIRRSEALRRLLLCNLFEKADSLREPDHNTIQSLVASSGA